MVTRSASRRWRGIALFFFPVGLAILGVVALARIFRAGDAVSFVPTPVVMQCEVLRQLLALPASLWWLQRAPGNNLVGLAVAIFVLLCWRVLQSWFKSTNLSLAIHPLPGVGLHVTGVSAAQIADLDERSPILKSLAVALEDHALIWLRATKSQSSLLSPRQLRDLYYKIHCARFKHHSPPVLPVEQQQKPPADGNLRGISFAGFPETNVLGFAEKVVDWHGLSGCLKPTAWWERARGQWHHDGGFSATAPPPPALVMMYCEEAPRQTGFSTRILGLDCPPGATLFYSTHVPLEMASADVAARSRRLRCCYKEGFGRVQVGEYPKMSDTLLTPLSPPIHNAEVRDKHRSITEFESFETLAFGNNGNSRSQQVFCHRLVQQDSLGREFIVVHTVCLDYMEELQDGVWRAISWASSQEFLETLLAPATTAEHILVVDWRPGDVVLFDNLQTQHSVTPTNAYSEGSSQRRRMTRTAMQPSCSALL